MAMGDKSILAQVVADSKPVDVGQLIKILREMDPNSNFAQSPDLYIPKDSKMYSFPTDLNAAGFVGASAPNMAFVNKNHLYNETSLHELAHTEQNQSKKKLPNTNRIFNDKRGYEDVISRNKIRKLSKNSEHLSEDFVKRIPPNMSSSEYETGAHLQAIEGFLPKGKNVMDTQFGREVFNTPRSRRLYESFMYPSRDKVFPSDHNFNSTPSTDYVKAIQRFIRNKTGGNY